MDIDPRKCFIELQKLVFITVLLITNVACMQDKDMILEFKDIQSFNLKVLSTEPTKLKLSGLVFHSSLVVREITTNQSRDSLIILVKLGPTSKGFSGNIDYSLTVPDDIDFVKIGREKVTIWNR